jgi:uncharacterized protein YaaQ|eukprot:SAG25_NODE_30_length_20554_cov_36.028694_8_plen_180_part_00
MIGESNTLSQRSLERLRIRANHTLPIGLVDMISFIESTAMDLISQRIRKLATTTGWVNVVGATGLVLDGGGSSIDPFVAIVLNGTQVGQTHQISYTGPSPQWHERVTYPAELLRPGRNVFKLEIYDFDQLSSNDLLGSVTIVSENGPQAISTEVRSHACSIDSNSYFVIARVQSCSLCT